MKQRDLGACLAEVLGYSPRPGTVVSPARRPRVNREERAGLRILLVEDNAVNQEVGLGILENLGYWAEVAATGREAIEALTTDDFDLVLMDCQLPEMDGYEATTLIRRADSPVRNHAIPIIAMTAYAMAGDREKCLAAGMDGYIPKPVQPSVLESAIEQWTAAAEVSPEIRPVAAIPQAISGVVFDDEDLLNRLMGDDDLARRIIRRFLEDLPQQFQTLSQAVARGDTAAVMQVAHAIKGAAANTGGTQLRELAAKLEQLGRAGDLTGAAATLPEFSAGLDAVRPVMERFGLAQSESR